jgi:hypothetical protein
VPLSFVDRVLARAGADFPASGLLSDTGLRNVVAASYQLGDQTPQPSFSHFGADLTFGGFGFDTSEVRQHGGTAGESALSLAIDAGDPARIDMLWRGTVRAGASYPLATIGVESAAPLGLAGIDAEIPGGPPGDPAALETARRAVVLARLKAAANDPDAYDDAFIDRLISAAEADSLAQLIAHDGGAARFSQLVLSLTPIPGSSTVRSRDFPVAAAILVRDIAAMADPLATLLHASQVVIERLRHAGFDPRPGTELPPGRAIVVWIIGVEWFDQSDWPGGTTGNAAAQRAERIGVASTWLARQGIALSPI